MPKAANNVPRKYSAIESAIGILNSFEYAHHNIYKPKIKAITAGHASCDVALSVSLSAT